jgi:hypothetical protein
VAFFEGGDHSGGGPAQRHIDRRAVTAGLVVELRAAGATVELPVAGLGLGERLAWYETSTRAPDAPLPAVRPWEHLQVADGETARRTKRPSRYAPLGGHLDACQSAVVTVGFYDIEEFLAVRLPAPARRHRAWCANDAAHGQ